MSTVRVWGIPKKFVWYSVLYLNSKYSSGVCDGSASFSELVTGIVSSWSTI